MSTLATTREHARNGRPQQPRLGGLASRLMRSWAPGFHSRRGHQRCPHPGRLVAAVGDHHQRLSAPSARIIRMTGGGLARQKQAVQRLTAWKRGKCGEAGASPIVWPIRPARLLSNAATFAISGGHGRPFWEVKSNASKRARISMCASLLIGTVARRPGLSTPSGRPIDTMASSVD
jgi:hypothetical protein